MAAYIVSFLEYHLKAGITHVFGAKHRRGCKENISLSFLPFLWIPSRLSIQTAPKPSCVIAAAVRPHAAEYTCRFVLQTSGWEVTKSTHELTWGADFAIHSRFVMRILLYWNYPFHYNKRWNPLQNTLHMQILYVWPKPIYIVSWTYSISNYFPKDGHTSRSQ